MHEADPGEPDADQRITGAQADDPLQGRERLLQRPGVALHQPIAPNAFTWLRFNSITVSYSEIASTGRRPARSSWPLAKGASGLRGDTVNAWPVSVSARVRS